MENFGRRKFVKFLGFSGISALISPGAIFANSKIKKNHYFLPEIPFEYFIKPGKLKGSKILVLGGIHGNEPGAYKASDLLIDCEVKRGTLAIVPRSNYLSILNFKRGYNGDMNRKFQMISSQDPDFYYVEQIKELIKQFAPDVIVSLHDGYGFHLRNKKQWGQCIVIDAKNYNGLNLYKTATDIVKNANKKISNYRWKLPVFNTKTFNHNTKHIEQRKSLTYFALKNFNIPAYCFEVSKQLPVLKYKVLHHLYMLENLFKKYNVEISPSFDYLETNIEKNLHIDKKHISVKVRINNRSLTVNNNKTFYVPFGSIIKFEDLSGYRGTNIVSDRFINQNWRKFYCRGNLNFFVKNDYKKIFKIRFISQN